MFRKIVVIFVVLLVVAIPGFSQPEQAPAKNDARDSGAHSNKVSNVDEKDSESQSNEASNVDEEDSESQSYEMVEGDIVYLKSGKELRGVTVARENPLYVEIEFIAGEAPLKLPRTAVERIEYAADKISGRTEGGLGDVRLAPDIMPGEEVSAEFGRMLTAPMSEQELVLEEVDYLVIIRAFAEKFGIIVDVNEALNSLPPEQRKFSRVIPAGKTFMNFLRSDLAEIAPEVRAILKYDKLVLQKREDVPAAAPAGDIPPPPVQ